MGALLESLTGLKGRSEYPWLLLRGIIGALLATELSLVIYDVFVSGHTLFRWKESGFVPWVDAGLLAAVALLRIAI